MITKDGYRIIIYTALILAVFILLRMAYTSLILDILIGFTTVIFVFHFSFFRDPDRRPPGKENQIVSPADGKVIKIDKVKDESYHDAEVQLVSIFMNILNVHVNRIPISGTVDYLEYKKGQFRVASLDDAMDHNEQMAIGIRSQYGKILFNQVAGIIARRIVCRLGKGESVKRGERFGMIKYSSRLDLFLPLNVDIKVTLNEKVKAGTSIIGEFIL